MPGLNSPDRADALRRVPCRLLDDLLRRRLAGLTSLAPEDISTAVLRDLVTRVEIHGDAVQMVLGLKALRSLNVNLGSARTIETRLHPGDRLLAEASRLDHVRMSIPIRMKMRGGRTWSDGPEFTPSQKDTAPRLAAIKRLCGAHDAFTPTTPALARQRSRIRSTKPPPKGFSKLDWVFLAPGIQSAILNGRLDPATIARLEAQPAIPLSWAAQRRLLELDCAPEHPCA